MKVPGTRVVVTAFACLLVAGPGAAVPPTAYPRTPRSVVEAYCKADLEGAQTASETWPKLARYAIWPDAPGWDTFTIVSGYSVAPAGRTRVRVVYTVLGVLAGEEARTEPRAQQVVYTLVRRRGLWKIADPQLEPHVSPEVAMRLLDGLEHSEFVRPDLDKIRASREVVRKMLAARPGS